MFGTRGKEIRDSEVSNDILSMTADQLRLEVATLRERCAQLELRLEKAAQFPLYTTPNYAPINPPTERPKEFKERIDEWNCGKCGLSLSGNVGYVCPRIDCARNSVSC
jgi:hypothetical protein